MSTSYTVALLLLIFAVLVFTVDGVKILYPAEGDKVDGGYVEVRLDTDISFEGYYFSIVGGGDNIYPPRRTVNKKITLAFPVRTVPIQTRLVFCNRGISPCPAGDIIVRSDLFWLGMGPIPGPDPDPNPDPNPRPSFPYIDVPGHDTVLNADQESAIVWRGVAYEEFYVGIMGGGDGQWIQKQLFKVQNPTKDGGTKLWTPSTNMPIDRTGLFGLYFCSTDEWNGNCSPKKRIRASNLFTIKVDSDVDSETNGAKRHADFASFAALVATLVSFIIVSVLI